MSSNSDPLLSRSLMVSVNAEIDRLHRSFGLVDSEFFCECGDPCCKERLSLSRAAFAELRSRSAPVLVPAHAHRGPSDEPEVQERRGNVIQLASGLASRATIERAKGILAERGDMTPDDAFEALRRRARREGRTLKDVCSVYVASVGPYYEGSSSLDANREQAAEGSDPRQRG